MTPLAAVGRPRVFSDLELARNARPSRRARDDNAYADRARGALPRTDPRYAWLYPDRGDRVGVLSELGRILTRNGDQACTAAAASLCAAPPATTRAAVEELRRRRIGRPVPIPAHPANDGDYDDDLAEVVTQALADYWAEHPESPEADAGATLRELAALLG